jgi:hypothetical protein
MLPGLRFLFSAVVLTMSMLVFGLGAAALLRASHDRFVTTSKIRSAPPPMYAQHGEPATPALTMLRVDAPASAPTAAIDAAITVATAGPEPREPPPSSAEPTPAAQVAVLTPVDTTDAKSSALAAAPAAEADVAATMASMPPADSPPVAIAAAPAVEIDRTDPTLASSLRDAPAANPIVTAPVEAAKDADPAVELAAINEAQPVPVPPKLPVARPIIKKKPATAHRVVKKRRHIVRRRAIPAAEQPFGAPSSGS